tara:strand:- start:2533 stop:3735 length:1203 start_codon:yes stop_codon:yes gene_type:complete
MSDYIFRKEILNDINKGKSYNEIINSSDNKSKQGFIYETICILCIIFKQLIPDYQSISDTKLTTNIFEFIPIKSIRELMEKKLHDGDNLSDISIKSRNIWSSWSIKYGDSKRRTDLVECKDCMESYSRNNNTDYNLGLIVQNTDKQLTKHRNSGRPEAVVIKKAFVSRQVFDENNIKEAFLKMKKILINQNLTELEDIYDFIDKEYLNTPGRIHLKVKFNQKLALIQFRNNLKQLQHCLSHKPRSGKTITLLLMAQELLKNGYKRVLIMTSIPDTLKPFMEEINKYYEFKDIQYKSQEDFDNIDENFNGLLLCSVQFLKTNYDKKKDIIKLFDSHIFDECHFHSSNGNTLKKIINVDEQERLQIFASGTSGKTEWFYDIPKRCVYKWDIEDEIRMKKFTN